MRIWEIALDAVERLGSAAVVAVMKTEGSAPRDTGAMLVVTPEGFSGSIGGGELEWRAIAAAQAMMPHGADYKETSHVLGPDLGQCCGGRVELLTEAYDRGSLRRLRRLVARGDLPGEEPRPLFLFGAGHVGRALILALAPLPFEVLWIDSRPDAFPSMFPENVTPIGSSNPTAELKRAERECLVLVMTHSHALDLAIVDAALRNPGIAHVGLIGSATKRARFEKRLREVGVDEVRIAGLICPIGVPGIRSKEPAMIAASTAAQLLMLHESLNQAVIQDVIPAKAGTHPSAGDGTRGSVHVEGWVPAFAGMTTNGRSP